VLPTLPPDDFPQTMLDFGRTMLRVFTFPVPTIAAVTGHAIAGGAMLMFACDLRWVADGAFRIHLNESAIGLTLPSWAIVVAQSAVPLRRQTEAVLHARLYSPGEALERGMIDAVVPPEQLLDAAQAAAAPLLALDTRAYGGSKRRLRAMTVKWVSDLLETEARGGMPARSN